MRRRACMSVSGMPWHFLQLGNYLSAGFYSHADCQHYLDTQLISSGMFDSGFQRIYWSLSTVVLSSYVANRSLGLGNN